MTDTVDAFIERRGQYHAITRLRLVEQRAVLHRFEASLGGRPIAEATGDDLAAYAEGLVASGLAPNTVLKHLKMIRPFFTWLWDRERITADRLMRLRNVKPPRGTTPIGKPRPYTRAEVEQFYAAVRAAYPWVLESTHRPGVDDHERALYYVERWKRGNSRWGRVQPYFQRLQIEAIVALQLHGALRCHEAFQLSLVGMHPDNDYVAVIGAAKNPVAEPIERAVPWMTDQMRDAVGDWLAARRLLRIRKHEAPWLSLHQQHARKPMDYNRFKRLIPELGWTNHRLRHTGITEMMRAMPDTPHIVQRIAGHARLSQTLAYAELLPGDVVKVAQRATPEFTRRIAA